MSSFGYATPASLDEAVSLLNGDEKSRLLAGGQSLLLYSRRQQIAGSILIDLHGILELSIIELQPDGTLKIGAMITLRTLANDDLVRAQYPVLAEAADLVGDAQVRNRATLGGSLSLAHPEGDLAAVMLAMDAQISVVGRKGTRLIAAEQFFTGPYKTALARDEIVTAVVLPTSPERFGMAYLKVKHPATLYALCGVCAAVTRARDEKISRVRIGATGALEYPVRLGAFENAAAADGAMGSDKLSIPDGAVFRNDMFASAEYRQHLLNVTAHRAVRLAAERAGK